MFKLSTFPFLNNALKTAIFSNSKKFYSTLQEQTIKVKGQTINYIKTGEGDKALLCFPGLSGTIWSDFKPQITNLDQTKFTIVAWDPPGYGSSRPPDRNFNIKLYENDADIAVDFMQQIGIPKFSLLAWNNGGISSMIISAKHSHVVDKLVIWGANSYITLQDMEVYEKLRDLSKWSDKMRAPLLRFYTQERLQKMWNGRFDMLKKLYSKNNGNICGEFLPKIKCPTLILHGDMDPLIAAEHLYI